MMLVKKWDDSPF